MGQRQIRIIGGEWRGRKLKVLASEHLRPTPDRVRETLFNWLAAPIVGARCLDLFAGSGALGFEALSRGAAFVTMIDDKPEIVALLEQELTQFAANERAQVLCAKIPRQMPHFAEVFDIVFMDPPYQENLLLPCCALLEEQKYLANTAYIYLEARAIIKDNDLPSNWHLLKSKKAGQVYYHLALRKEEAHSA